MTSDRVKEIMAWATFWKAITHTTDVWQTRRDRLRMRRMTRRMTKTRRKERRQEQNRLGERESQSKQR